MQMCPPPPLPRQPSKYFSDPAPHLPTTNFITPPPPYFFWIRACYCWLGLTCKILVCYFNYMKLKLFRKLVAHKNIPVGFIAQRQHRNSFDFFLFVTRAVSHTGCKHLYIDIPVDLIKQSLIKVKIHNFIYLRLLGSY